MSEVAPQVRVRMAPGPTGPFHIGRSRTALINWLFARHHGGVFLLRIEDTDQKRSRPEYLTSILDSLRWLGLNWDEGPDVGGPHQPYFQMGRLDTYRSAAEDLLSAGHAYPCYCTPEELEAGRRQAEAEKRPYRYPRTCRYLTPEQRAKREAEGREPVLRLAVPLDGETSFEDLIVGTVTVQNSELDDFVIMRPNRMPLYNFAVVVDDTTMEITHVIRGQDHVPNTPRQVLMYRFLGRSVPTFAHLPLVLGMDRGKMSARHGAEAVTAYGNDGFLPEALVNYLATIGITYGEDREIYSLDELAALFDISKIGKSGAAFDEEKLEWMNGVYIRALPLDDFVRRTLPFLQTHGLVASPPSPEEVAYATSALRLEQERVRTLADAPDAVAFFFARDLVYDPVALVGKKSTAAEARRVLEAVAVIAADQSLEWSAPELERVVRAAVEGLGMKPGPAFTSIRVAVTGRTAAPPLFDTLAVLGRERVVHHIGAALSHLERMDQPAQRVP